LFGVDISGITRAVEQAENPWLAPEAIKRLVIGYFQKRLSSSKSYITGERLNLTVAEKAELLDDYIVIDGRKDNSWAKFLRSGNTSVKIVFSQDEAKDPSILFVNALHPLVKQSAKAYKGNREVHIAFKAAAGDIAPGKYPFYLYTWEYTGGSPRTNIVAICEDSKAQAELPGVLQNGIGSGKMGFHSFLAAVFLHVTGVIIVISKVINIGALRFFSESF